MVKVLFFAHLREEAGTSSVEWDGAEKTLLFSKEKLANEYGLTNLENAMMAVNEEFASDDYVLKAGDTLAFIPPVSGG
jgi:molybdopterin synthase sulfur carrier subunit